MPPPLIEDLLDPANHPPPQPVMVELITTHISWILRTGHTAWKIKRPVRFDFLDYGDRETRRHHCEEELRLNRRLAPEVYLGLGRVVLDHGRHRLVTGDQEPGAGEVVEHAVHMRRLDDDRTFEALLERGELGLELLDELARRLAAMHAQAPCAQPAGGGLERAVSANLDSLRDAAGPMAIGAALERAEATQREWLARAPAILEPRRTAGRVRECHGDLRLEHVYLSADGGGLAVIDGVEFDPALRCIDVGGEIAFLAADCERCAQPGLGEWFLARYALHAGDYGWYPVIDGLIGYRLLVMAKIACLKAVDEERPAAEREALLRRARRCTDHAARHGDPRPAPRLIVLSGLIASGKSSVADELARGHGMVPIASDRRRKQLAGLDPQDRGDAGLYTREWTERTYAALLDDAAAALQGGRDVVCDATFSDPAQRCAAIGRARACGARPLVLHLRCGEHELRRRLRARAAAGGDPSDADESLLAATTAAYRPPTEDEGAPVLELDTEGPHATWRADLARLLHTVPPSDPAGERS